MRLLLISLSNVLSQIICEEVIYCTILCKEINQVVIFTDPDQDKDGEEAVTLRTFWSILGRFPGTSFCLSCISLRCLEPEGHPGLDRSEVSRWTAVLKLTRKFELRMDKMSC